MATIEIERQHQLPADEALRRSKLMIDELSRREGLQARWDDARCHIKGTSLTGHVQVEAQRIVVAIDLGLPMRPFTPFVRNMVQGGIDRALAEPAPLPAVPHGAPAAQATSPSLPSAPDAAEAKGDASLLAPGPLGPVRAALAQFVPGRSLPQALYLAPDAFAQEMASLFRQQWQFVDHGSRLPAAGDWITHRIGNAGIIVLRGRDGVVRAFHNVCPHRGSTLCQAERGHSNSIVCPYHSWRFNLEGQLVHARAMGEDFNPTDHGLRPLQVKVLEEMIYVALADGTRAADSFERGAQFLQQLYRLHGLARARVAQRQVWKVKANWKLVSENFLECYHCTPTHPEYCSVNSHAAGNSSGQPAALSAYQELTAQWTEAQAAAGRLHGWHDFAQAGEQALVVYRQPIREGYATLSQDGKPLAPLMGEFDRHDGGESVVALGSTHFVSAASDHATVFRFTPIDCDHTEVVVSWLVDQDAVEGRDYDPERLRWMWQVTTEQDKLLAERNHEGVRSPAYRPGPYSNVEAPLLRFTARYVQAMREGLQ